MDKPHGLSSQMSLEIGRVCVLADMQVPAQLLQRIAELRSREEDR